MEDDPFDRAIEREADIRRRLDDGEITAGEAEELRALADDQPEARWKLSFDQLSRVIDEDLNPAVIRVLLDDPLRFDVDGALDLVAEHDISEGEARALGQLVLAGIDLDADSAAELYGYTDGLKGLAKDLSRSGLHLSIEQLTTLLENDISVKNVDRMLEAAPDLSVDEAIELCIREVSPDSIRRLRDDGLDVDYDRLGRRRNGINWGFGIMNLGFGRTRMSVALGNQHITEDTDLIGLVIGRITIEAGVHLTINGLVTGDLVIEPGAEVKVNGAILGDVANKGGRISVNGTILGDIRDVKVEVVSPN